MSPLSRTFTFIVHTITFTPRKLLYARQLVNEKVTYITKATVCFRVCVWGVILMICFIWVNLVLVGSLSCIFFLSYLPNRLCRIGRDWRQENWNLKRDGMGPWWELEVKNEDLNLEILKGVVYMQVIGSGRLSSKWTNSLFKSQEGSEIICAFLA